MSLEGYDILHINDERTCAHLLLSHGMVNAFSQIPSDMTGSFIMGSPLFVHQFQGKLFHVVVMRFVGFEKAKDNGYMAIAGACAAYSREAFQRFVSGQVGKVVNGTGPLRLIPIEKVANN